MGSFYTFLKSLPTGRFAGGQLSTDAVPELLQLLGIGEEEMRFEFPLISTQTRIRIADVAVLASNGRAFLAVEAVSAPPALWQNSWVDHLREMLDTAGTPLGLLLTHGYLAWIELNDSHLVRLGDLEPDEAAELRRRLVAAISHAREEIQVCPPEPDVDTSCLKRLQAVHAAVTNEQKKRSLEDLSAGFVEATPGIRIKHRNLRTSSSELDLVVEVHSGSKADTRLDVGRHFVVECKNWSQPVGAREIRDFVGKLVKVRSRLGVLISRRGVTGRHGAVDALREIRFCYDHLGVAICVVSEEDLQQLCRGHDLVELLDSRLDRLRFDMQ